MTVLLDMSKATVGAESAKKTCNFRMRWVAKLDRLVLTDGEVSPEHLNVNDDFSMSIANFQQVEDLNTTQERTLIAY